MKNIIDFISGNLTKDEERSLLHSIADNNEMRSNLKQALAIDSALNSKPVQYETPEEITNGIFNGLGFKAPISVNKPAGRYNPEKKFTRSHLAGAALFSSMATVLIMLLFTDIYKPDNSDIYSGNGIKSEKISSTKADKENINSNLSNIIPAEKDRENENRMPAHTLKSHRRINESRSDISIIPDEPVVDADSDDFEYNVKLINYSDIPIPYNRLEFNYKIPTDHDFLPVKVQAHNQLGLTSFELPFEIEYRQTESWNLPKETISPGEFSKFYKSGLALYYPLSESFKIGPSVRQETFYMEYKKIEEDGYRYRLYQQPNYTTIGLAGLLSIKEFSDSKVLARFGIGGNSVGGVGRLGLEYQQDVFEHVSLFIGLEYSSMLYRQMNSNFTSEKISLNYGIRFN